MKLKGKVLLCILLFIIMIGLCFYLFTILNKEEEPTMTFKKQKTIEYHDDVNSEDLILEIDGTLIEQSYLDTNRIGTQRLKYTIQKGKQTKDFYHAIEIIDTKAPVIETLYDEIVFDYGEEIDFRILEINVYDEVDGKIEQSSTLKENTYIIEHQIDHHVAREYEVIIKAMDGHGLITEKKIKAIVKEEEKKQDDQKQSSSMQKPITSNDEITPTYINGILLVNKQYPIPRDFGGENQEAYEALLSLQNGALLAGYDMSLLSGYRSYDYQKSLYESYVARDGEEAANRYSAKPGTSEHQSGLAFDVGEMTWDYGETAAGKWLKENCAQYGFILRYMEGKEHITGYMYEPWHIRYVGVEHATAIMNQNITLEEYLGVS